MSETRVVGTSGCAALLAVAVLGLLAVVGLGSGHQPGPATATVAETAPAPSAVAVDPAAQALTDCDRLADEARANQAPSEQLRLYRDSLQAVDAAAANGASEKDTRPRRSALTKQIESLACSVESPGRQALAGVLQDEFYKNGMDATVKVTGSCVDRMQIDWLLWSGPSNYEFQHGPIPGRLRTAGFKSVRLQGYDTNWTYDFTEQR